MATAKLPLIILVHGSWHQPSCFSKLQAILENQGYEVFCHSLPTNSKDQSNPSATHLTDVAALHEQILPFFKEGKEAVIVGHSYGAVPAMVCVEGHYVEERAAKGLKGGFRAIVFLSGFAFPVRGMELAEAMDVNWIEIQPPWATVNENARKALYNGLPEAEIDELMAGLVPMTAAAAITPVEFSAGELKIPKTYVMTLLDGGLPLPAQERIVARTPDMKVVKLETGHSSFLVMPERVAEIIVQAAEESEGRGK